MAPRTAGAILLGALAGGIGFGVGAHAEPPASAPPTIVVATDAYPDDALVAGATIKVEGHDWPANSLVQLEVCGNQARSGSTDCVVTGGQTVGVDGNGTFRARVAMTPPPTPCPCIVRALNQSGDGIATAPVRIPGVPEMLPGDLPVTGAALRRLDVSGVSLEGSGPWQSWFGGHPKRTLVFTVANTGTATVRDAVLSLTVGSSNDPTGFVKPIPLGTIDVGERKTFRIPVELAMFSFRRQVVKGTVSGSSQATAFSVTTTAFPWLLVLIPGLVVLQLLLVSGRNVLRRRLHARDSVAAAGPSAPELVAGPYPADRLICVIEFGEGPMWGRANELCDAAGDRLLEAYSDDPLNRTNLAVLGLYTAKLLTLHATGLEARPEDLSVDDAVGLVHRISILALGGITQQQAHDACADLAEWIAGTVGVQVLIENSIAGADHANGEPHTVNGGPSPGAGAPVTKMIRLHAGTPTMYFRIQLAGNAVYDVTRVLEGLHSGDMTVSTYSSAQGSEIYVRLADTPRIGPTEVYDVFAERAHISRFEPIGPVPLTVLTRTGPERWAQLGLDPERTFESLVARASQRDSLVTASANGPRRSEVSGHS